MGIKSPVSIERAICSASKVLRAISVCSFEYDRTGQLVNKITYPVCDFTFEGSPVSTFFGCVDTETFVACCPKMVHYAPDGNLVIQPRLVAES